MFYDIENYDHEEEFMYIKTYMFIKGYALAKNMTYTSRALPLARYIHNGQHRKGTVLIGTEKRQLPYIMHVLKVASTLLSLSLPFDNHEMDILISAALLHDAIEDGKNIDIHELMKQYGLPDDIWKIIQLLTKHKGATEEELQVYFDAIKKNKFAMLVKLSDRSHNVEDLYNMKADKLHKYVKETRKFIYPIASYGKNNYPELSNGITILKAKIVSLTELTETVVEMYDEKIAYLTAERDAKIQMLEQQVKNLKESQENKDDIHNRKMD